MSAPTAETLAPILAAAFNAGYACARETSRHYVTAETVERYRREAVTDGLAASAVAHRAVLAVVEGGAP